MRNREAATDGLITGYTGGAGFAELIFPGYLTVDLGAAARLTTVRLLLWDGLGDGIGPRDPRGYKYRLLLSADRRTWTVAFDSGGDSYNGWQVFCFKEPIDAQYVRVHGLWNSANAGFHVVQVEAYDDDPPALPTGACLECEIGPEDVTIEETDGLPLEKSIDALVSQLEDVLASTPALNPEPFRAIVAQLRLQVSDVSTLERRMGAVRRQLIEPVATELTTGRKYSVGSYWFGLGAGIVGVLSLIISIILALRS